MRGRRVIFPLLLAAALLLGGCGSGGTGQLVTTLVQGNIDTLYKGRADKNYLLLVKSSEEECQQDYRKGLEDESDYFADYIGVTATEEQRRELAELFDVICTSAGYTVGEAKQEEEDVWSVELRIQPLDIMDRLEERYDEDEMIRRVGDKMDAAGLTPDERYERFDEYWLGYFIDLLRELLPEMGYLEEQTLTVRVVKDDDGAWVISDESMGEIADTMIHYP